MFNLRKKSQRWFHKIVKLNYNLELYHRTLSANGVEYKCYYPRNTHQDPLLKKMISDLESDEMIFDIGSHIGIYTISLLAAEDVYIHAFDPDTNSIYKMKKNLRLNNCSEKVSIHNVAISNKTGQSDFFMSTNPIKNSLSKKMATDEDYAGENKLVDEKMVNIETVDNFVEHNEPPDRIKIDAEGFGFEVLDGAKQTLINHQPDIYLETHYDLGKVEQIEEYLENIHYSIEKLPENPDFYWYCYPHS